MFAKISNYKEVLVFYIILALILLLVSYRNKQIDMHALNMNSYVEQY